MIRLTQTASELLLYVPSSEKERAKAIPGRRWNSDRKCWAYPKTRVVYEAIIAEFGKELPPREATAQSERHDVPAQHPPMSSALYPPVREAEILQTELLRIRQALDEMRDADATSRETQVAALEAKISERERELSELRQALSVLQDQLRQSDMDLAEMRRQLSQAQDEQKDLRQELERAVAATKMSSKQFVTYSKNLALTLVARDPQFARLCKELNSPRTFPVAVRKELEVALRRKLDISGSAVDLRQLLDEARERQMFSQTERNLAYLLRSEGNAAAHEHADADSVWPRCLMVMYAIALLWPALADAQPDSAPTPIRDSDAAD